MRQPKGTRGSEFANRRVHFLVLRVFRRFREPDDEIDEADE
jgi:hypothetical protein